ncbi:MAG TPA: ImmA/IrrE family metallo-endopeptidase [Lactobacillus sp.]|nr:ImmA/IrrE family metallo-endopeptidase [Lactobacillus sp.]
MENLFDSLLEYAKNKHITIIQSNVLSPTTPPAANPALRKVLINLNWEQKNQIPFQLAHEIGHVLNDDPGILYNCTQASHNTIEFAASKRGISLLIDLYFADISIKDANSTRFVQQLCIPPYLVNFTETQIRTHYVHVPNEA